MSERASLVVEPVEVVDVLLVARQSLIDHAAQLPLKRRDHGPALVKIDALIERLAEAHDD